MAGWLETVDKKQNLNKELNRYILKKLLVLVLREYRKGVAVVKKCIEINKKYSKYDKLFNSLYIFYYLYILLQGQIEWTNYQLEIR